MRTMTVATPAAPCGALSEGGAEGAPTHDRPSQTKDFKAARPASVPAKAAERGRIPFGGGEEIR